MGCGSSTEGQAQVQLVQAPNDNYDHPVPLYEYDTEQCDKERRKFINQKEVPGRPGKAKLGSYIPKSL